MTREELIKSPEYWTTHAQIDLYESALSFMEKTGKNRKELAEHLGVSKSYVSQLLNGDFDHRLSKFVELSLAFGFVPKVSFIPLEEYAAWDSILKASLVVKKISSPIACKDTQTTTDDEYFYIDNDNDSKKTA